MTAEWLRLICPTGCLVDPLSSLLSKNFALLFQLKSVLCPAPSRPDERDVRVVTDVGVGCGGRGGVQDEARSTRTAKPCGPDAPTLAFKLVMMPAHRASDVASHHTGDGDNKARSPGRARSKPLKPLRGEGRFDPTSPVVTNSCVFILHTRLRVRPAPGLPCALLPRGTRSMQQLGRDRRGGNAKLCLPPSRGAAGSREYAPDDRLRDEAIHAAARAAMGYFASLAMTVSLLS